MNDTAYLIGLKYTFDEDGNHVSEETRKRVFAKAESIYSNEFFQAGQSGIKAELKLTVWEAEYSGERLAEYKGRVYDIYRTFTAYDTVELYLSERVGD